MFDKSKTISISQAAGMLGEKEDTVRRWVQQRALEGASVSDDNEQVEFGVTARSIERVQRVLTAGSQRGR